MSSWSAENAIKAYLSTLKIDQKAKEPSVAEFISALAAGNNAQLMVVACAAAADSTTLALIAAANQTNGNVVCIVPNHEDLIASKNFLGVAANQVKLMVGKEAQGLDVVNKGDFVVIDCNLVSHEEIVKLVQIGDGNKQNGIVVVGYNAFGCERSWRSCGSKTQLLPIGEGLLVTRFGETNAISHENGSGMNKSVRSRWIMKVDKCTGEEHVYRVRPSQGVM
ncbi:uncharacterized protein LOC127131077 [Lathyrus oleraceus]|uniref:S-adenosyl-L-methionine-dependent methyltransferase n=1 Tax=Pisum sativum TaxID=3888 RepID=A0A9D5BJV5_PEA|nr:uncharacterized protein LOC127131077 [Pisum sativum]KAI5444807.1 hypothetical protein KIW84_013187 [Pisum sativum]